MLHYQRKLPAFPTITASNTFAVLLPVGPTYKNIMLEPTIAGVAATVAQMRAQIGTVRLRVNGRAIYELPATDILDNNTWHGYPATAGLLPLFQTFDWVRTVPALENLAWGTANIDSLTLEVTMLAGATIDKIVASGLVVPEARQLAYVVEAHQFTFAPAGAGTFEIATLPKGNGDLLELHFSGAVVTAAEVKINGVSFQDCTNLVAHNNLTNFGERVPVANYTHFDFTAFSNMIDDRIPLGSFVQDFRVILTVSGAGTVLANMFTLNRPLAPIGA